MTMPIQRVIKKVSKVIPKVPKNISLHIALLVMSSERKNYASMARANGFTYEKVYIRKEDVQWRLDAHKEFLHALIKNLATKECPGFLIIDFTLLLKQFSEHIPSVTYDYDGVGKRVAKGFSAGFVFWSNGIVNIPFDYVLWLRKKDAGELYKKKTELAKELIMWAKQNGIPFAEVRLDGAFACVDVLRFLVAEGIHFTMRIPSNRVIETENGKHQLAKHPELRLQRNQKYKTIYASYKDISCYFTTHKRNGPNDTKEVVYIVSSLPRSPKEHVDAYDKRWPAEKCFRTEKQHIGLTHCQSTDINKQRLHVFSVMTAYAVLQCMKIDQQKKSLEEVIHPIRRQKIVQPLFQYLDLDETIMC
jgi:hypothetical protein